MVDGPFVRPPASDEKARGRSVAALFVAEDGPYIDWPGVDAWPEARDARTYAGALPVVAHPPCERWGRFAKGAPCNQRFKVGDDGGCFQAALAAVQRCGGIIEHPQGSRAWRTFDLPIPSGRRWTTADAHGGRSCYIDQGAYGHIAKKPTWLYAVLPHFPKMDWTRVWGRPRIGGTGFHSRLERAKAKASSKGIPRFPEVSKADRYLTPRPFAQLLIELADSCNRAPIRRGPAQVQLEGIHG